MTDTRPKADLDKPVTMRDLKTFITELVPLLDQRLTSTLSAHLDLLVERLAALEAMQLAERDARERAHLH